MAQEVGGLDCCVKQLGLACSSLVDDTRHHEVTEVVGLEVETVGKRTLLILGSNLGAYHGLRLVSCVGIDSTVTLIDDNGGVDISVLPLGLHHLFDELVHEGIKLGILVDGIDSSHSLEPLVHITIVEWRAPVLAGACACSDLEIAETMGYVGIGPCLPHALKGCATVHTESLAPKSACPLDCSERSVGHYGMTASRGVGKTVILC